MTDKPRMIPIRIEKVQASDDYHDFINWLEDHNYCKVTKCANCYFWGDLHIDVSYKFPCARCRRHKVDTYHDDYCSDAVELKGGK